VGLRTLGGVPSIVFSVRGALFEMGAREATIAGEELLRRAAGHFGDAYGMEGSSELADAIELRLVGARDDPIALDDVQAIALFHELNLDPAGAGPGGQYRELYLAVRAIHDAK
jgi:hypothetical protein